jgi:hypothetical protein
MNQPIPNVNGKMKALLDYAEGLLVSAYRYYVLEMGAFLLVVLFSFYWSFAYQFPMGYSGLFSLMTEKIISNHFIPPHTIDFYGPGGIPFAYPPLGLYINAILTRLFGIDQFSYLRFFSPFVSILTLFACYLLFRRTTKNRIIAVLAVILFLTTTDYLDLHVKSDGMVRGLALLFAICAIYFNYAGRDSKTFSYKHVFLAGLFLGLSFLTHLTYGVFCIFSVLLLTLIQSKKISSRLLEAIGIAAIALLVSAPWGLYVFKNFGLAPFLGAMNSHAALPGANSGAPANTFATIFTDKFLLYPIFYIACLPYWIMKRDWQKVVWGLGTGILVGESARFLAMFSSIALAELCIDLASFSIQTRENRAKSFLPAFAAILMTLFFILSGSLNNLVNDKPFLTNELINAASWMMNNSSPNSKYLFLSQNMNGANEWMPYLSRRTPVIGHWGSEWLGDYYQKHEIMSRAIRCMEKDSWECIQRVTQKYTSRPDYLIFYKGEFEHLEADLNLSGTWQPVFKNESLVIYQDMR